jgi:Domain of unknown function (DUF5666)
MESVMINRRSMLWGSFLLFLEYAVAPAVGQQADGSTRVRGVIDKLDAQNLTLKSTDGTSTDLHIAADTVITRNEPSSLAAVKPGDYIASAAVKGDDGKLRSTEVRIFPQALRGLGEGQRPMQEPGKMMTNASVSEIVVANDGQVLKVKFNGGTSELVVGPNVPIIAVVIANAADLKVGMTVFVTAVKTADGALDAKRILAQ